MFRKTQHFSLWFLSNSRIQFRCCVGRYGIKPYTSFYCLLIFHCLPDVAEDVESSVSAPDQARKEKRQYEYYAIVKLCIRASHVQLVEEPVEIEKRRREFKEDEDGSVVVDEWSLP